MPPGADASVRDVALVESDPWDVGQVVVGHLASKGFCIVDTGLDGEALGKAAKDVEELDAAGRLRRPPELIVEGLLGTGGSARIAQLECAELQEGLGKVDEAIGDTAGHVGPYLAEWLGIESRARTHPVLHEAAGLVGDAPELTEGEASDWLFQFMRGAVLCVVSMGPDTGTLELRPFDEDAETYSLALQPGMMVLVRSDTIVARYATSGRTLLLSSFLLGAIAKSDKHDVEPELRPCAKQLNDWAIDRLDRLKDEERDDERLNIPRDWIIAMNRQCFKGQHMAARGMSTRMPVTWNEQEFFQASFHGVDYMIEVPLMRWDHSNRYNPDPESWRWAQTYSNHFAMVDGAELFDNKMFSLTPAECKIMDPQQRIVLENGYEALAKAGYKRGQIMNSTGGMYLGFGTNTSDFNYMEKSRDAGAEGSFGATGGSAAICANRFSFCMGMRGPSISIDAEDASGLVAVHSGCEGLQRRGRLTTNFFSLVGGIKLNLSPYFWPQRQAMGFASRKGRCLSFDSSADGMCLGDNATNITLNALTEVVDNEVVVKEYDELIGVVAGSSTNHNGRSASFNSPNGPAEQEVLSMALRSAGLSGFDIDASECYAFGGFLADAVEASSVMRVMRLTDQSDEVLGLTAIKSSCGNSSWATGAVSLARTLLGHHWGCLTPNLHMRQVNPHIDAFDQPMCFMGETVELPMRSSYTQSMARGFGGTNATVIAFGSMGSDMRRPPPRPPQRDRLIFWPGGGGKLDAAAVPRKGFYIAGTFTQWEAEPMEAEAAGSYSFMLTLGENRWEQFQIWIDGDPRKCLYPELPKAPKQTAVCGPSPSSGGNAWHIEGRTHVAEQSLEAQALADIGEGEEAVRAIVVPQKVEVGTVDRGLVGARYRICLRVSGKYRLVDWQRLSGKPEDGEVPDMLQALPKSSYFVSGDFNGWGFQEMTEVPQEDARSAAFTLDLQLLRPGGEFQILRNRDWDQAIYPLVELAGCEDPASVGGPDDESLGRVWCLDGRPGDRFRLELRRSTRSGRDEKLVSWTSLGHEALSEAQRSSAALPRFAVFGSWDAGARLRGLGWAGAYHRFFVELGEDARANFQLVRDFDWDAIFHPSVPDAREGVAYRIGGPAPGDGRTRGLNWSIGLSGSETPGEIYEVRVFHEEHVLGAVVSKVEWSRVQPGADLAAAEAEGLVLRSRRLR